MIFKKNKENKTKEVNSTHKKNLKKTWAVSTVGVLGATSIATPITLALVFAAPIFAALTGLAKLIYDSINSTTGASERVDKQENLFNYYSSLFLFDNEQKKSLDYQIMFFNWDIFVLESKNKDLGKEIQDNQSDANKVKQLENQINDNNKSIEAIKVKIQKVNNTIANPNANNGLKSEYSHGNFSSEYPKVIPPIDVLRDKVTRIYNDEKNNYINKFATKREGENAWLQKIKKDYNNSTNDDDAIKYKLFKDELEKKSFGQFNFLINDEFTFEQKWARVGKIDTSSSNFIFPFLSTAYQVNPNDQPANNQALYDTDPTTKSQKIYFFSTKSSDSAKILVDIDNADPNNIIQLIIQDLEKEKLVKVNHALIAAKQGTINAPWTFDESKKTLLNIQDYYGSGEKVLDILPNLFKAGSEAQTEIFINYFSNDPSGFEKYGSLGIKSINNYVKDMNDGFSFGVLGTYKSADLPTQGEERSSISNFLETLKDKITDAQTQVWGPNVPADSSSMQQAVAALNQDQKNIFGRAFTESFNQLGTTPGSFLYYPVNVAENIFAVISTEGLHVIKRTDVEGENLKTEIKNDLNKIVSNQDLQKGETNWTQLFNDHFNSLVRAEFIANNYNTNNALKNFIVNEEANLPESEKLNYDNTVSTIASNNFAKKVSSINESIKNKVQDFYYTQMDSKARRRDLTLEPEDVYNFFVELVVNEPANNKIKGKAL